MAKALPPDRSEPAGRSRLPGITTQIFIGLVARHRRRLPLAGVRRRDQAARRRVPAHDQDDHRAAAVLDAGRRHRRHRRPEVDGPHRPQGDHLFRDRDDDRAVPRPRARQHLPAGRRRWRCRSAPTRRGRGHGAAGQQTGWDIFLHLFPTSVIDAMARGDILQLVVFSIFFGVGLAAIGERASRSSTCSRAPRR